MATDPPSDVETQVRTWLRSQGFALEYEAARHLKAAGFHAVQGRTYQDAATEKTREIDVVARALLTKAQAALFAVVECKGAKAPWIVRKSDLDRNQRMWLPVSTPGVAAALVKHDYTLTSLPLPPSDKPVPYAVVQAHTAPDSDPAYGSVSQAVSAAVGAIRGADFPSIALPVVVLDAPLFELYYDEDGGEELVSVESSRLLWQPSSDRRTLVDIVQRSAMQTHAMRLRHEFGDLADELGQLVRVRGADLTDPYEGPMIH